MNEQDTINAVMTQARDECVAQAPDDPTESELSAMYTRRALIICERRQGALEATQAKLVEAIARDELWAYSTPEKPEGWASADEMVRATFDEIEGDRKRRCLMRGVATVAQYAVYRNIATGAAVGEWGKFQEVLPEMKQACLDDDAAKLTSILTDVVKMPTRDKLRDKYKGGDKPKAGAGRFFRVDGTLYFLARVDDGERAAPSLGKLFDIGDNNGMGVTHRAVGDQIEVTTYRAEKVEVSDLWDEALEPELETTPR